MHLRVLNLQSPLPLADLLMLKKTPRLASMLKKCLSDHDFYNDLLHYLSSIKIYVALGLVPRSLIIEASIGSQVIPISGLGWLLRMVLVHCYTTLHDLPNSNVIRHPTAAVQ
ncbi:Uncharacterized protein HZ326_30987 [Fusarium oxysporum f. sp. albedinis]|nr:Uncharacterized protein HZ326_30987 [Fusarium oxysporum f. sp. albedinis]